jgi:hypothetical protein
VDACDEVNDECVSTANDNLCVDDQLFCTGQEICDVVQGCVSTGDPCPAKTTCNEDTNACDPTAGKVKVTLCHKAEGKAKVHTKAGGKAKVHTITVGASAVASHLAHGDVLGACPD